MEQSKFEKLVEKASKEKIIGNDEYEYMKYHPENLRDGYFPFDKKSKLTMDQKVQLEKVWETKRREFLRKLKHKNEDAETTNKLFKPIYIFIGIIFLIIVFFGGDNLINPGDFSDTLRNDDARR